MIEHTIEIVIDIAITLHQPETAGIVIDKAGNLGAFWIVQGPPDALPFARPQSQTI